jgi:hypothetical protein
MPLGGRARMHDARRHDDAFLVGSSFIPTQGNYNGSPSPTSSPASPAGPRSWTPAPSSPCRVLTGVPDFYGLHFRMRRHRDELMISSHVRTKWG